MVGNVPKIRAMINAHSSLPAVAPTAPAGLQIAVRLDARVRDKADAIAQAALLLQDRGCVAPGYATGMQAREAQAETFLGHGVAIPHGRAEDRALGRSEERRVGKEGRSRGSPYH